MDGFVGVKSHRARASVLRLTTWRRSLSWSRSDLSGRSCPGRMLRMIRRDFDLPETMTVEGTDAEFEIERPKGDTEEVIVDTEQLNLF